jgi:hypothetical protein
MLNFNKPADTANPFKSQLIQLYSYSRVRLLKLVDGLQMHELDYNYDDKSNSIGTLLKHIAALEYYYQRALFENKVLTKNENAFWHGAKTGQLYLRLIKGNDLCYYTDLLQQTRRETFKLLEDKNDNWLFEPASVNYDPPLNNYTWLIHVVEDEMNHAGQIKLAKLRLGS